jgi:hypothetical protein
MKNEEFKIQNERMLEFRVKNVESKRVLELSFPPRTKPKGRNLPFPGAAHSYFLILTS